MDGLLSLIRLLILKLLNVIQVSIFLVMPEASVGHPRF
jgi:hypothetical protein